jgi:quercetin dioxygenase-like cupin family protein
MAYKGKRITNPVNGQTIEFITTAAESKGRELEMISTWQPNSLRPAEHFHPHQDEVFKVLEGELSLCLNGKIVLLHPGEAIHIPAKAVHSMWNKSNHKTIVSWQVFPAYNTEYFLETGMGLAADGKTGKSGLPGILQVALLAQKFRREFRMSKPSYLIQRILFWLLTPLAMLNGKRAVYPKYID